MDAYVIDAEAAIELRRADATGSQVLANCLAEMRTNGTQTAGRSSWLSARAVCLVAFSGMRCVDECDAW